MKKINAFGNVSLMAVMAAAFVVTQPDEAKAGDLTMQQIQTEMNYLQAQVKTLKAQQKQQTATERQQASIQAQQDKVQKEQVAVQKQQASVNLEMQKVSSRNAWYMVGNGPHPKFVSADKTSSFQINGEVQLDSGLGTVPNQRGFSGGTQFRRAELKISGVYAENFVWKLEEDFAKTSSPLGGIVDMYGGYQSSIGNIYNLVLIGNQHVPFLQAPPSDATLFLETDLPSAFGPPRAIGITDEANTKHWNLWFGVNGPTPKQAPNTLIFQGNSQSSASVDFSYTPINQLNNLFNVEGTVVYAKYNSNAQVYASTPDANVYGVNLVSTPSLNITGSWLYAASFDFKFNKRWAGRGEAYVLDTLNSNNHTVSATNHTVITPTFTGYELETDYFLTDDTKPWDDQGSNFLNPRPEHPVTQGGIGAIQIAARIDQINLNATKFGIHGGNETNLTAALNWYPTAYTRVMINYIKVLPITGGGASAAPHPGTFKGASPTIVAMRLQFIF